MSALESLPRELLIEEILRLVDHNDLRLLLMVSKNISEATKQAKKKYFDYKTPKNSSRESADIKSPNPVRPLRKRRIIKNFPDRTVLFPGAEI